MSQNNRPGNLPESKSARYFKERYAKEIDKQEFEERKKI